MKVPSHIQSLWDKWARKSHYCDFSDVYKLPIEQQIEHFVLIYQAHKSEFWNHYEDGAVSYHRDLLNELFEHYTDNATRLAFCRALPKRLQATPLAQLASLLQESDTQHEKVELTLGLMENKGRGIHRSILRRALKENNWSSAQMYLSPEHLSLWVSLLPTLRVDTQILANPHRYSEIVSTFPALTPAMERQVLQLDLYPEEIEGESEYTPEEALTHLQLIFCKDTLAAIPLVVNEHMTANHIFSWLQTFEGKLPEPVLEKLMRLHWAQTLKDAQ